jgi:GTPase SAR1 family protein
MEPEPEPAGEPTLTAPHSAEEGVPPGEGDEAALRAELATLKKGALNRRARQAGVEADILDDADDADDPRAEIIELIIKAKAAAAEAAEDDCVTLQKTSSRDERARVEQMLRKFQLQADPDIRERLEKGEWKRLKRTPSRWWQTDMADRVNRLRAAARIRSSLPDDTRAEIPNLYPQLVVLGDGNTGKSTVLNRFAEFSFSAVSDGVCTRRPVRLQLRPVRAENRMRMHDENLLALCQMEDTVDNFKAEYPLRKAEREEDEDSLRCVVETRASAQAVQDGTAAAFDAQYIMEELVITIEADQMIYFDLVDLPGLDNISTMPEKMANKYINPETLPRTFVLIFAQHKKGDTQLMHRWVDEFSSCLCKGGCLVCLVTKACRAMSTAWRSAC